jgi:hypothetical protein
MKTKANSLTSAILNYIRLNQCHAERVNNYSRTVKDRFGNDRFVPSAGFKGTADIHAVKRVTLREAITDVLVIGGYTYGQFVAIEVKIGRDKLSEAQEYYRECVQKAGGVYIVAHDFDEFLREWELI